MEKIFKHRYELVNHFRQYRPLVDADKEGYHLYRDIVANNILWNIGDFVLFQHITSDKKISTPILACFISFGIWDQALVFHFVETTRARHLNQNFRLLTNPKLNISMAYYELDPEVDNIQFWTDDIKVLGHWNHKPNYKQLRKILTNEL